MKFKIHSIPRFEFELTEAQVSMLVTASALHYDYTCRSLSMDPRNSFTRGGPEGLLVGWHNIQQGAIEYPECGPPTLEATWRELDLCLKCMESPLPNRQYEQERLQTTWAFYQMMNRWRAYETVAGAIEGETT